jgi:glycine/sarcosine N-methyltransferase
LSPFYRDLSHYYDSLFPLNQATVEFIRSYITVPASIILDIGCATGQLAISLAELPLSQGTIGTVFALDPDEKMVTLLKEKNLQKQLDSKLTVLMGGMSDLESLFKPATFHLIYCLGNTLVHLTSLAEIQHLFQAVFSRLKNGGLFIFQIVNYTRILSQNIMELPVIDKPAVTFTRQYRYHKTNHLIQFFTRLTLKETGHVLENETSLYPLEYHQVAPIIDHTHFETIACLGSFNREPWNASSPALILVLKKN